jgi:hypothetical protein
MTNKSLPDVVGEYSLWFIALICLTVIIALGLKLPSVTLTQIGICLELVAAFLVTPELLGTERLARIEEATRAVMNWLRKRAEHTSGKISEALPAFYHVAPLAPFVAPGDVVVLLKVTLSYTFIGGLLGWIVYGLLRFPILILTSQVALTGDLPLTPFAWGKWLNTIFALSSADVIPLGVFFLLSWLNHAVWGARELIGLFHRRPAVSKAIVNTSFGLLFWITLLPSLFLTGVISLFFGLPAVTLWLIAWNLRFDLEKGGIVKLMVPFGVGVFVISKIYQFMGTF